MRADRVWEVARKDMESASRHRYVLYGFIGVPLIFALLIPLTTLYPAMRGEAPSENELPPFAPPGMEPKQALVAGLVDTTLLMFMFLPSFIPSVIASYTFVGEKVNRQLEPLLAAPLTDLELLTGKLLGALLPTLLVTWASFAVFVLVVDLLTFPLFGYLLLPNLLSAVVLLLYCPLISLLSISWSILVSSRVSDVRAAMQLGGVAVLPTLAFYLLCLGGILPLEKYALAGFWALLALTALGLFLLGKRTFGREEILTRWR
ncbi:MAG: ABC transporter permease subunit [Candidatus Hadarchaeales archaeon]